MCIELVVILAVGVGDALQHILGWFVDLEIISLQKIFYLLSINLLLLGTVRFFVKAKRDSTLKSVAKINKTVKTVDLSLAPIENGEQLGKTILSIKKGGIKMKEYFSKMSKTQVISIVIMFISLVLGIVMTLVPALAQYEQYVYAVGTIFGGASFTGAFATGKNVAKATKNKELSEHKALIKSYNIRLSTLEIKYADIIQAYNDVQELGGELTFEQQTLYNTYATQKASLEKKIADEEAKFKAENSSAEIDKTE